MALNPIAIAAVGYGMASVAQSRPAERSKAMRALRFAALPEAADAAGEPMGYETLSRLVASAAAGSGDPVDRLLDSVRAASPGGLKTTGPSSSSSATAPVSAACRPEEPFRT